MFLPGSSFSEIGGKHNEIAVSFNEVFRHLLPEGLKIKVKYQIFLIFLSPFSISAQS